MTPIRIDPELMSGKPCFTGTRVPVRFLFDSLGDGRTLDQFLHSFPTVKREQALAVLDVALRLAIESAEIVQPDSQPAGVA